MAIAYALHPRWVSPLRALVLPKLSIESRRLGATKRKQVRSGAFASIADRVAHGAQYALLLRRSLAKGAHSYRVRESGRIVRNHHQKRPSWSGGLAAPLLPVLDGLDRYADRLGKAPLRVANTPGLHANCVDVEFPRRSFRSDRNLEFDHLVLFRPIQIRQRRMPPGQSTHKFTQPNPGAVTP
jgi:hypothetical protein